MTGSHTGHSAEGPKRKRPHSVGLYQRKCPEQKNPKTGKGFLGAGTEERRWSFMDG